MDEGHTVLINAFAMICEAMLVSKAFGLSLRLTDLDAGHPKPLLLHQMVLAPLGSLGEGAAGCTVELVRDPGVRSERPSGAVRHSRVRAPQRRRQVKLTFSKRQVLSFDQRNVRPGKCASRLQQLSMLHAVNRSQGAPNCSRTR
jgi:hypothetical protein